jgi:hypothetical protein
VAAEADTGAYVHPPALWNSTLAVFVNAVPPTARRLLRAVNSMVPAVVLPATLPSDHVNVRDPSGFDATLAGFGPAPRSSAVL